MRTPPRIAVAATLLALTLAAAPERTAAQPASPKLNALAEGREELAKLDGILLEARRAERAGLGFAARVGAIAPGAVRGGEVRAIIGVSGPMEDAKRRLAEAGLTVVSVHPAYSAVVVACASAAPLEVAALLPEVRVVVAEPQATTSVGATTSQGDAAMLATQARAATGATGAGVHVGILSDTFNRTIGGTLAGQTLTGSAPQTTGDLPATVRILDPGPNSGTDEGAAMAEIVHDLAPGASISFASAFTSYLGFADNILALAAAGADVVVDDVIYFTEPMYQDGPIAAAAQTVADAGIPYFSSAGNFGSRAHERAFADSDPAAADLAFPPSGADLHDFGGGARFLRVTIPTGGGVIAVLHWNQPYGGGAGAGPGSAADLDLYLLRADTLPVSSASVVAAGGQTPQGTIAAPRGDAVEFVGFTNTGPSATFYLAVDRYQDPPQAVEPTRISLVVSARDGATVVDSHLLGSRTVYGHAAAAGAFAVGAAIHSEMADRTPPVGGVVAPEGQFDVESFSSLGGNLPFEFASNGAALAATEFRFKPEIVAPDGTNTTFFGQDVDSDGFPNFFGTSAAAPHAAAVAALMLERDAALTPGQMRIVLAETAVDSEAAGRDSLSGDGWLDALAAVSSIPNGASVVSDSIPATAIRTQAIPVEARLRNAGSVAWTAEAGYSLGAVSDPCGLVAGGRVPLPAGASVAPGEEFAFVFDLAASATAAECALELRMEKAGVGGFGETLATTVSVAERFDAPQPKVSTGWFGGATSGSGSVASSAGSGLCMTAPASGENVVGWVSPERYVPLADLSVYRMRFRLSTDQTATDAIPRVDFSYDNFNSSGFGNAYFGETMIVDQAGGSNGVGRPRGRTEFELWATPNAAETPQWRGLIDPANSAFSPQADSFNDMRVVVRLLDLDSAGILSENDSGSVCVGELRVDRIPVAAMAVEALEWGPPLANATHRPETFDQAAEMAGFAEIDDARGTAFYTLTPGGPGSRKTLVPYDPSHATPENPFAFPSLFPARWRSNVLYKGTVALLSNVRAGAGPEGTDPVDAIFVDFDTATTELISIHGSARGSPPDNLHLAASPRLASTAGGPQNYVAYHYGHNVTSLDLGFFPGADGLRILPDFLNHPELGGPESGTNPLAVVGAKIERIVLPAP